MKPRRAGAVAGQPFFGILGPLTAGVDGGQLLDIGSRKQRELLAVLLLHLNALVPAGRIADAIWHGEPPASADVTLRTHVSHLRSRLASVGAQDVLVTRSAGYGLFVDPDHVDAARFEHLLGAGREALERGETERAQTLLTDALELWRGPVLDDLAEAEFVKTEAARLEELRLVALEQRIDAALALGRHHAVVADLERLVVANPYREQLHCRLMLALYRSGRQADALRVSASVRARLIDELGVDPGPALRDLETAILRHDQSLLLPAPAPRPVTAPPAATTKYRPPASPRRLVERARLTDTLRGGGGRRLTVIRGPAGFGKTTLAAQWREMLVADGVTVAWLTTDDDDNDVVWFLTHLIDAVRTVKPDVGAELRATLEEHGAAATRFVLATLINDIDRGANRFCVIIDDWHRITDAPTIEAMAYLIDNCPSHLQLVVATRTGDGLPLSRVRVCDQLVEIDSAALRFDNHEARTFLVDVHGLALDDSDVAALERTTDGWAAGLQLASLSLRDCDDPAELISRMSGRHHAIAQYLAENVLDSLDPETLDFLLATSVTERICGGLASALAGVEHGQALLEQVENRDLFLRRLDDEREWFRYHHLFADFLRRRLMRDHPDRIAGLHAAASRWFAEHNMLHEAINHAMAAGDEDRAIELLELHGIDLFQHAQLSTLRALVSKLPSRIVTLSPRIQLAMACGHMLLQQRAAAHAALDAFESAAAKRAQSAAERHGMRLEANVFRAMVETWTDHLAGVDEMLEECLARPDAVPPVLVGMAANVATFLDLCRFDFKAARVRQEWAYPYHDSPFNLICGHSLAGRAAHEELDVVEAERRCREALSVAQQFGASQSHAAALAQALLAELLYERGDLDGAERLLDECTVLGSQGGEAATIIARHVIGARIKSLRGDRRGAAACLDDGARIAATIRLPRLRAHVENERVRLNLAGEDWRSGAWRAEPLPDGGLGEITAQMRDEAEIRAQLTGQPGRACDRAQAWVERVAEQRRPRALLQANRLLVAALTAAGRTDEAKHLLTVITAQCAERGMVRYLLDGGDSVIALLTALRDDMRSGRWQPAWAPVPSAFLDAVVAATQGT
ncbi:BTAD domain-containing putative transcriptional regulator [Mycolicibacterium elephantis]|uniref:OmpR/PhoB-type domain-containing protein n=1 Tax=Mycolicibacterium elephantis DSM 44368 TaxID=1335622 RepID=A0A439DMH8_9MYCO|nr:BTAD domain-containing putative transcriptional regulator [Mycolicibacterium elephantis]MCV7220078.1 AAA family ATPase [Mycolicibacterium elephantis]RWA16064.1 hypothetical protein MELE44368_08485 [Mycolicibacterium elephantis DSM 44368]